MEHPGFYERAGPFSLAELAEALGAALGGSADPNRSISNVMPLDQAAPMDLSFFDNRKYLDLLAKTDAGACLVAKEFVDRVPAETVVLETPAPYKDLAKALSMFYPDAVRPKVTSVGQQATCDPVHPSAVIEPGATIEIGAIVGPEAHIGSGTVVASGAVIGYRVYIGRDSFIGPNVSIVHALLGNRVIIHSGVQIGQDGFGFAMGPQGHQKVPQVGRVIIQDDVEIGANSTVDRGALNDTIVGEGTKIDNLVQIGHNVVIGRHCVLVAQTAIAGSTVLEDFVAMGGQSGVGGHVRVGAGAQIAAGSKLRDSIPAGAKYAGYPARPLAEWGREIALLKRMTKRKGN